MEHRGPSSILLLSGISLKFVFAFSIMIALFINPVFSYAGEREIDIIGIKLGDTISSAKKVISSKMETAKKRRRRVKRIEEDRGTLKLGKYKSPEFLFSCQANLRGLLRGPLEEWIKVACDPTSSDGKIIGIRRSCSFREIDKMPNADLFYKSIVEKYGKPYAENTNYGITTYYWFYKASTNYIKSNENWQLAPSIISLMSSERCVDSDCAKRFRKEFGKSLTCDVHFDRNNQHLVKRYTVNLIDNPAVTDSIKKLNEIMLKGVEDIEKNERERSKKNKPTF